MKVTKIKTKAATTVNVGNYENYKFETEVELEIGDDPIKQVFSYGWGLCNKEIKERKSFLIQSLKEKKFDTKKMYQEQNRLKKQKIQQGENT
jgi:hypothetical protein